MRWKNQAPRQRTDSQEAAQITFNNLFSSRVPIAIHIHSMHFSGPQMTGFCAFSPPGNRATFTKSWCDFLAKLHRKPGERGKKSTGENSKQSTSGDGPPKIGDFCPLSLEISAPCRGHQACPELYKSEFPKTWFRWRGTSRPNSPPYDVNCFFAVNKIQ